MYLSRLKLNSNNRTTRELNINQYLLHQAIYRAFPDVSVGGAGRILYRLDISHDGKINLLVQSEKVPDWDKAEILTKCLEEPVEKPKDFPPPFTEGQTLFFLLRANPSIKKKEENKKNGYRLGLIKEEDQLSWFKNKAEQGGFAVISCQTIPEGISKEDNKEQTLRHYAVRFEGVLKVVNPELFKQTVERGIGSAKGFGFGLLSVAPVRD
jgi:CRISPR system Cascade subunit CasE